MPWTGAISHQPATGHYLRTYFIALAANGYACVHYNVMHIDIKPINHHLNTNT